MAETAPSVGHDLIGLVTSRAAVDDLLKLHDVIDLVIPRGSNALVRERGHRALPVHIRDLTGQFRVIPVCCKTDRRNSFVTSTLCR